MSSFRLGLIADIQYADCDDGTDFSGMERRYFRNSLNIARRAVDCWNAEGVVQLGDIIDGCNSKLKQSEKALKTVLDVLSRSPVPRYDLMGNHELYNLHRDALEKWGLRCGAAGRSYYSAHLGDFWEGIFLDPFEVALIGLSPDSPEFLEATQMMQDHNPQVLSGAKDWFAGLPHEKHRFVPYNGAISQVQLEWLKKAIESAEADSRKILIFLHVPLYEPATKAKTVVWNAEEILQVLHQHGESVVAVFAGHDHDGGYAVDEGGLHHITMNSPLTATGDCFAILECHEGWAHFKAYGRACVESNTLGRGLAYPELILAKDAVNVASPVSQSEEGSQQLQAMGFNCAEAKKALEATSGNVDEAVALLCG
eukprot:symbB.v1.2.028698.t1/scaffold3068.1/size68108/4